MFRGLMLQVSLLPDSCGSFYFFRHGNFYEFYNLCAPPPTSLSCFKSVDPLFATPGTGGCTSPTFDPRSASTWLEEERNRSSLAHPRRHMIVALLIGQAEHAIDLNLERGGNSCLLQVKFHGAWCVMYSPGQGGTTRTPSRRLTGEERGHIEAYGSTCQKSSRSSEYAIDLHLECSEGYCLFQADFVREH